ncbi:MAG: hypothetical protein ACYDAY_02335 [Candidatus Dormibacteria bacterium]
MQEMAGAALLYPGGAFAALVGALVTVVYAASRRREAGQAVDLGAILRPGSWSVGPAALAAALALAGACALAPLPRSPLAPAAASLLAWLALWMAAPWIVLLARARVTPEPDLTSLLLWSHLALVLAAAGLLALAGSASVSPLAVNGAPGLIPAKLVFVGVALLSVVATLRCLERAIPGQPGAGLVVLLAWVPVAALGGALFAGGEGPTELLRALMVTLGIALVEVFLDANLAGLGSDRLARLWPALALPAGLISVAACLVTAAAGPPV